MVDSKCKIADTAWVAPSADVLGDVTIGEESSVWFHATIRAERSSIHIGKGSNIQDNCVVHVDEGYPVHVGDYVTVGHGAILHGCTIGDETLIGMGATVLNGAKIGKNCVIGAGALVKQDMVVPDGMMAIGMPARVLRALSEEDIAKLRKNAQVYVEEKNEYCKHFSSK